MSKTDKTAAASGVKHIVLLVLFLLVSCLVTFFALEGVLYVAQKVTGNPKFAPIRASDYPAFPHQYLKIAVFGESAAAGYNAEAGFADVIRAVLNEKYQQKKTYVKNYAASGYTFHKHQAELIKTLIDRYDVFLIYTGNNEAMNYLDETGFFRRAEYRNKKSLETLAALKDIRQEGTLRHFLETKSRLYTVMNKVVQKINRKIENGEKDESGMYDYERHFQEIEADRLLPAEEYRKLYSNFQKDLEEIAALAAEKGKYVFVSSLPTHELYKPFFSTHRPDLTQEDKNAFHQYYAKGMEQFLQQRYPQAIEQWLMAYHLDDSVAILNYMMGRAYVMLGQVNEGRAFLRRSIDEDGFPARALNRLFDIEAAVSRASTNLIYIDSHASFYQAMDTGLNYDNLLIDLHHPSFLGHVMVAHNFLCRMAEKRLIEGVNKNDVCVAMTSPGNTERWMNIFKSMLHITNAKESESALNLARWHLGMSGLSAYPEDYLKIAEKNIKLFLEKSPQGSSDQATHLLFMALIENKRGHNEIALEYANQALKADQSYVTQKLFPRHLLTGDSIQKGLADAGIIYQERDGLFSLEQKPVEAVASVAP